MTLLPVDIKGQAFSTRSVQVGLLLRVALEGSLDMDTAPQFERFLSAVAAALANGQVTEVLFETQALYVMSSTSLSHWATWLKRLKLQGRRCRVRFVTNPNLAWQRRTLEAIARVAEHIVSVE